MTGGSFKYVKVPINYRFLSVHELNTRNHHSKGRKPLLMYLDALADTSTRISRIWEISPISWSGFPGSVPDPPYPGQDIQDLSSILHILSLRILCTTPPRSCPPAKNWNPSWPVTIELLVLIYN